MSLKDEKLITLQDLDYFLSGIDQRYSGGEITKEEFNQLAYGDNCGGKNLWSFSRSDFSISSGDDWKCETTLKPSTQYTIYNGGTMRMYVGSARIEHTTSCTFTTSSNGEISFELHKTIIDGYFNGTYYISLTEGTVATDKPYIPSVKMLSDKSKNIDDIAFLGWEVPAECPIQNEYSNGVFTQKVGRVDLGSLSWSYVSGWECWGASSIDGIKLPSWDGVEIKGYSYNYTIENTNYAYNNTDICLFVKADGLVYCRNGSSSTKPNGYLYYELATPKTFKDGQEVVTELKSEFDELAFSENGGYNKFDEETRNGYYDNGAFISYSNYVANVNAIKVEPNTNYYYVSSENCLASFYDASMNFIGSGEGTIIEKNTTFTTPSNANYLNFRLGGDYGNTYKNDIAIIKGTSGTYKPYIMSNKQLTDLKNDLKEINNKLDAIPNGASYETISATEPTINVGDTWLKLL